MRRKLPFLVFLTFSTVACSKILGVVTGDDYLELNKESQMVWGIGVIDGLLAQAFWSKRNDFEVLSTCLENHKTNQLLAIFDKDLKDQPESWHAPAALVLKSSLEKFCAK